MSKLKPFELTGPLPGRNAFEVLRQQLLEYLIRTKPAVGTEFMSDHQLAKATGLARNTVRKAVDLLSKEGWFERRQGKGTFIGTRAMLPAAIKSTDRVTEAEGSNRKHLRLAVLLGYPAGSRLNWYSMGVLQGLEEAAINEGILIDLFNFGTSNDHVRRRLEHSRPDVLACLSPHQEWAMLIADLRLHGIPVLLTGSRLANIGIPTLREDGAGGAAMAVRHLLENGHRRIGFIQDTVPVPWAFERFHGYVKTMTEAGLDPDDGLSLWVDQEGRKYEDDRIGKYLDRVRPTALILGSAGLMRLLAPAVTVRKLSIPRDLSLITFDQNELESTWIEKKPVTTVALPLENMGRVLARQAREVFEGRFAGENQILSCQLDQGATVLPIAK